ncbi:MAG: DHA2 family efflux MFS transporter permease subunit [Bryobacterales bacterium]|nr:DHA2 family efflux MFS transporter permease subunit [Bryobacterales bacterium]
MADAAAVEGPNVNPWFVAAAVMFGTFMEVLDTTVVNVALPHIAGSMSATVDEATWSLTSYLVANAIILPMTGWLASTFGRKRLVQGAVVGFTISSILCGFAPNLASLIVFRVIQGATGGTMQPLSQAIMLEAFPPKDRGKAMGFWGLGIVVAPMLGPVLGGWLTDNFSWRWVFYINLPVGIIASFMIHLFVFDPHYLRKQRTGVDYWGIGLLAVGVGALQIMLDKGQQEDWLASNLIRALLAGALLGLGAFVVRELTAEHPIVDLRVFRNRTYSAGVFLITSVGVVLYGSLVLLPVFLQTLLGYPALQAGVAMAPRGFGSFLAMPMVGVLVAKIDPRKLLALGIGGAAFTLHDLSRLNLNAGYWDIFWPQFWQGIALSLLFVPLTTSTMDSIPREQMGNAASLYNFMRNIGGSFGIALSTTLLARSQQRYFSRISENITPYDPAAASMLRQMQEGFMARGADAANALEQAYAAIGGIVQRQAAMLSFIHVFQVLAMIFVAVLPLLFLMRRPRRGQVTAGH